MMDDMDAELRALVDAVRPADGPTEEERRQNRIAIVRRLGRGTLAATSTLAVTSASAKLAMASWVVGSAKVLTALVLSAGVALGTVYYLRSPHGPTRPTLVEAPARAPIATASSPPGSAWPAPPTPVAPASEPIPSSSPARLQRTAAPRVPLPSSPRPDPLVNVAKTRASSTLDAELPLLQQAQRFLQDGRPQLAHALLDRHQALFPGGVLAEERAGLDMVALCSIDRGSASANAKSFLAQHPGCPLAVRIRDACGL